MSRRDPYHLLGPFDYTSDTACGCDRRDSLVLRDALNPYPIVCGSCFGEVLPELISLPPDLVEPMARWRDLFRALYTLWLDSDEYESWARERLCDPAGSVNVRGRTLTS